MKTDTKQTHILTLDKASHMFEKSKVPTLEDIFT